MFSIPWSIGAVTDPDGRIRFDDFYRKLLSGSKQEHPIPGSLVPIDTPFPRSGLVFDYCYEVSWPPLPYHGLTAKLCYVQF